MIEIVADNLIILIVEAILLVVIVAFLIPHDWDR